MELSGFIYKEPNLRDHLLVFSNWSIVLDVSDILSTKRPLGLDLRVVKEGDSSLFIVVLKSFLNDFSKTKVQVFHNLRIIRFYDWNLQ